ncbi:MAG: c-type cytochrome biogenesis protein CcmI [Methylococcaceae bacterium]|nr:c-type cytochrome biogenesis protein CcmI [Methylococcaceae bacterium]
MNITYWLIIFVLLMIAFFIIIPPLWKIRKIQPGDFDQRNIHIAQQRVQDLNNQLEAGSLTPEQFEEQYDELELSLNDDLSIKQKGEESSTQGRWVAPVILLLVPLLSISGYLVLGEPDALLKAQEQPAQQTMNTGTDINGMISGLIQQLKQQPDNAKGWVKLGRSYKYIKKYQQAVNCFEKAHVLMGDQPEVMLYLADSLAMVNGGQFSDKASELVFKALEISPNNEVGLWLAGMVKTEQKEISQAMQYWLKLETLLPADSNSYRQLQALMATVRAQNPDLEEKNNKALDAGLAVSINVQVSIDDSIKSKTGPTNTVFIYAKALSGPPMPLAIVRKQVADLPVSVTLDDAMAMMPAMKLSNFKQVKVMARISKSGAAKQQKGDFIGSVELSDLTAKPSVVIIINQEIQ